MERVTGLPAFFRNRGLSAVLAGSLLSATGATSAVTLTTSPARAATSSCNAAANAVAVSPSSGQLVMVIAPSLRSRTALVELFVRRGGCFRVAAGPYGAYVGRNGLSAHHVEGDGTTPTGLFAIGPVIYGVSANPGVRLHYHRLVCGDWWNEDPRTPAYNHFSHAACGTTPPFGMNSEALWQNVPAYNYFAVIEYNASPVVPGRGSGIFLHVAKGTPTIGCVSVAQANLVTILRLLSPSLHPVVDITTAAMAAG